jgi:hypothetical protein
MWIVIPLCVAPGVLAAGTGQISGQVTEAALPHEPIAGIEVCAFPQGSEGGSAEGPENVPCSKTDSSGGYIVSALPSGQYTVVFSAPLFSQLNFISQYYNEKTTESAADPVTVSVPNATTNIDAQLTVGGQIAGTVTDATTSLGVEGAFVCAFVLESEAGGCALTAAGGVYTVSGLPTGEYRVLFGYPKKYTFQYYKGKINPTESDIVRVTQGQLTSGIDAALQPSTSTPGEPSPPLSPGSSVRPVLSASEKPLLAIVTKKFLVKGRAVDVRVRCAHVRCVGWMGLASLPEKVGKHVLPHTNTFAQARFSVAPGHGRSVAVRLLPKRSIANLLERRGTLVRLGFSVKGGNAMIKTVRLR